MAEALREHNLLRLAMGFVLLLVAIPVVWHWLKRRPGWHEVGVVFGVILVYWWAWVRINTPEERTHLIEYSALAILVYQALMERRRRGRQVWKPALLAFAATCLLGLLDEGVQAILPNRVFDIRDIGFNIFAAVMAIIASLAIARVRRWRRSTEDLLGGP